MENRRYKIVYFIAKANEILSYLILVGGIILGIYIASENEFSLGLLAWGATILVTLLFMASAQIPLIFIDTENNTRQIAAELKKTNAMLSETLGRMTTNLDKLAEKDKS